MLGLGALYFFLVFFNIAGEFLVNTAGFVLPAYLSLEAIFTTGKADDTQWLIVSRTPRLAYWQGNFTRVLNADKMLVTVLGRLLLPDRH